MVQSEPVAIRESDEESEYEEPPTSPPPSSTEPDQNQNHPPEQSPETPEVVDNRPEPTVSRRRQFLTGLRTKFSELQIRRPRQSSNGEEEESSLSRITLIASNQIALRREQFNIFTDAALDIGTAPITIINETNCIINVAFKTLTPMVFENRLMPGLRVTKRVPKFLYSIEVRVWTGNNEYQVFKDIVEPVAFVALTAASFTTAATTRVAAVASRIPGWTTRAARIGRGAFQVGRAVVVAKAKDRFIDQITGAAVRKHGIKATKPKTFAVRGGPEVRIEQGEDGQPRQLIELGEGEVRDFEIVQIDHPYFNFSD